MIDSGNVARLNAVPTQPIKTLGEDRLELTDHARAVACFLVEVPAPATVCISGDWGTGKTSFMNMVRDAIVGLDKEGVAVVGPFEAWRYENETEIGAVLFRATRSRSLTLSRRALEWLGREATVTAWTLAGLVTNLCGGLAGKSEGLPVVGDLSGGLDRDRIKRIGEDIEKQAFLSKTKTERLKGAFRQLAEKNGRVILMLDDIDRCYPDRAAKIIEALKVVMDIPGIVYVAALHVRNLRMALASRLSRLSFPGGDAEHAVLADAYLNKLIDLEYCLPRMDLGRAYGFVQELKKGFEINWLMPEDISQMLLLLEPNPRKIVAFVNTLSLARRICGNGHPPGAISKCLLLEREMFEVFARLLDLSPQELQGLEGRSFDSTEALALKPGGKGAKMKPDQWVRKARDVAGEAKQLASEWFSCPAANADREETDQWTRRVLATWLVVNGSQIAQTIQQFAARWRGERHA